MKVRALRILIPPLDLMLRLGEGRYGLFRRAMFGAPPRLLAALGEWRAVHAADVARRRVPAYRRFTSSSASPIATWHDGSCRPRTSAATSIASYCSTAASMAACRQPALPSTNRRGRPARPTTGFGRVASARRLRPTSATSPATCMARARWSRSTRSRWAPGRRARASALRCSETGWLRTPAPTRRRSWPRSSSSGTGHRYLVCGYPPFLKHLMDVARERGIPAG